MRLLCHGMRSLLRHDRICRFPSCNGSGRSSQYGRCLVLDTSFTPVAFGRHHATLLQVRQLSVELLLLYDHSLSLCNSPPEATGPPTTTNDDLHPSSHTHDPAAPPLSPNSASLLQLHHFPRLAKLLSVRREDPERLIEALSKPAISANGGRDVKRWARPKSAGAASSSWKRLTPSASTPTLDGRGHSQTSMGNNTKTGNSTRQGGGRSVRPTSAPGRRRSPVCGGTERESDAMGSRGRQGGSKSGGESGIERVGRGEGVVGWTIEDETSRGTRDLSSGELIRLVERLRKRLDRVERERSGGDRQVRWLDTLDDSFVQRIS